MSASEGFDRLVGLAWGLVSIGAFISSVASDKHEDFLLAVGFATALLSVLYRILAELESRSCSSEVSS